MKTKISNMFKIETFEKLIAQKITDSVVNVVKDIPYKFYRFTKDQVTTSLTLSDAGSGNIVKHYEGLLRWVLEQKGVSKFCRNFTMRGAGSWWNEGNDKFSLGLGYGTTFFVYKSKLFWITQSKLDSSGSEREKSQVILTGLTRDISIMRDMIEEFRYKKSKKEIYVNRFTLNGWEIISSIQKRSLSTVIVNSELKTRIIDDIQYFLDNKSWFVDRGLPYKKTVIFSGPPGTGKTSLIKTIASEFDKSVYVINISQLSDSSFEKAITTAPANSIIIIEDFDSCESTHSRIKSDDEDDENKTPSKELSLTTILNTLDGIVTLNGNIIFMTTNHIEKIDPALIRKGRVDEIYEIGKLKTKEIYEYISLMFPEKEHDTSIVYDEIAGCDIQAMFIETRGNYDNFITRLCDYALN